MRINFDEVACKATKRWRDADGKWRQQTRRFFQTISPFNLNAAGQPKSRAEIQAEVWAERAAWVAQSPPKESTP